MDISYSNVSFEGRKNPKLSQRRRQIKNLKAIENELIERNRLLRTDCDALELTFNKTTTLAYDNPKAPIASKLWKANFDYQYNLLYGSYSDYKKSKKTFAKEAVKNLDVLPFIKSPIKMNGSQSFFAKPVRNLIKNEFLDYFRIKTPEEKQLIAYYKEQAKLKAMHKALGY